MSKAKLIRRNKLNYRNIVGFIDYNDYIHLMSIRQELRQTKCADSIRNTNSSISGVNNGNQTT